ncbi:MAG: 1,4-dihydroxy-2-naphthoate octaprenyltransferase [Candidatus Omnitrophota bacterium]|nr:1,4-dihydroxy-2-naphthoate octaprenyltransferase [Candidatus Omnitrophota bacterium]
MNRLLVCLKATRAPFLTATAVPVVLGSVMAWRKTGVFNWLFFWFTFLGIALIHIGTNLANDYFDHKTGNDDINTTPTPFSGGSRVIQNKEMSAVGVLYFALVCFSLGSLVGLYLNFLIGTNVVLGLGLFGVLLAFFYTAFPIKIGYRGFGELIVGFCFGPLTVLGAYYVQAKELSILPVIAAIPVGILVLLILYINEFPDYFADKQVNKNTIVVLLGKDKAVYLYYVFFAVIYVFTALAIVLKVLPIFCLPVFFTVPLALKAARNLRKNFENIPHLLFSNAATIKLHLIIGIILSLGFVLDRVIKG